MLNRFIEKELFITTILGKEPLGVLKPARWAICRSARGQMPQTNPFKTQQGNMRILHQGLRLQEKEQRAEIGVRYT